MITFEVENNQGERRQIEVPQEINLNLMEVLRACDYPIEATCGGMALCATCHVEIMHGIEQLDGPTDAELDMLDTLPAVHENSRLACQIRINPHLENVVLRLNSARE